jgi:hypothetical protein
VRVSGGRRAPSRALISAPLSALLSAPLLLGSLGVSVSACAPWLDLSASPARLFEPLASRDLSGFEQRLAHLKRYGARGDAVTVATLWLYLLTCHPLPHLPPPQAPLWRALYASLYLEESRDPERLGHLSTLLVEEGLKNSPAGDRGEWARWPQALEGWPDEAPDHLVVPRRCPGRALQRGFGPRDGFVMPAASLASVWGERGDAPAGADEARAQAQGSNTLQARPPWPLSLISDALSEEARARLWRDLAHLGWSRLTLESLEQVGAGAGAPLLDAWGWWVRYDAASLLSARSAVPPGWLPAGPLSLPHTLLYAEACVAWRDLAARPAPTAGRDREAAYATALLMFGLCEERAGRLEGALEAWARLPLSALDAESAHLTRYHTLRVLSDLGRYSAALALRERTPPPSSPLSAPFLYALGVAHERAGDSAGLMALSTEVFRDRSWRRDPFLRGLFYLFVRALTDFDFESRVIELLEDLGPRAETYERVFMFAEVSIDQGRPKQATEAARWLLGHHTRGVTRYRYHAILAHAALLSGDEAGFTAALRELTGLSDPALEGAVLQGRRGDFFKERDAALTELMSRALPTIAEWGEEQAALQRRWLTLALEELQALLRERPESRSRGELTELYRVGRQMLDPGAPLAYAERVGRERPESLVLGRVRVEGVNLAPFEPRAVRPPVGAPWALTLVPRGVNSPVDWALEWPSSDLVEEVTR